MSTRAASKGGGRSVNTGSSGAGGSRGVWLPRKYAKEFAHLPVEEFAAKCGMNMRMARRVRKRHKIGNS